MWLPIGGAIACAYAVRLLWLLWALHLRRAQLGAAANGAAPDAGAPAAVSADASAATAAAVMGGATTAGPVRTLVVLGSGGHTTEMLALTEALNRRRYAPVLYVYAATDERSRDRFAAVERDRQSAAAERGDALVPTAAFAAIPRSREVYQSWPMTVLKTAWLVLRWSPRLVLCNGPGTCVPVAAAAFAYNWLLFRDCRIVFVESFCRAYSLSLSGKILYLFASRFVVQWPQLRTRWPKSEFPGVIC